MPCRLLTELLILTKYFSPGFHSGFLSTHTRRDIYHICMACFIGLLGPFTFFDVSKTKLLQLFTSLIRWISFLSMIILSLMRINNGHVVTPSAANMSQSSKLKLRNFHRSLIFTNFLFQMRFFISMIFVFYFIKNFFPYISTIFSCSVG